MFRSLGKQRKGDDVASLIARKDYREAIGVVRAQLARQRNPSPLLRRQLGDLLATVGKVKEAASVLEALAGEYAETGFVAKAVALLRRVDSLDPARSEEINAKIARLAGDGQQRAVKSGAPEVHALDFEEIGIVSAEEPAAQPAASPPPPPELAEPERSTPATTGPPPPTEAEFARELWEVVDAAFSTAAQDGRPLALGSRVVVSPLFKDFQLDELVAVISALKLLTFSPGDVLLREGDQGTSLYTVATGVVRAFVTSPNGDQVQVDELRDGAFFGETAVLTGQQRTATVIAVTPTEVLELDRATLDSITRKHPRVWEVVFAFAQERIARVHKARGL